MADPKQREPAWTFYNDYYPPRRARDYTFVLDIAIAYANELSPAAFRAYVTAAAMAQDVSAVKYRQAYLWTCKFTRLAAQCKLRQKQLRFALTELEKGGWIEYSLNPHRNLVTILYTRFRATAMAHEGASERKKAMPAFAEDRDTEAIMAAWNLAPNVRKARVLRHLYADALDSAYIQMREDGVSRDVTASQIVRAIHKYAALNASERRGLHELYECSTQIPSLAWFLSSGAVMHFRKHNARRKR